MAVDIRALPGVATATTSRLAAIGLQALGALALVALGWWLASHAALHAPGPYDRSQVLQATPDDFPRIEASLVTAAGSGDGLAYRIEYRAPNTSVVDARAQLAMARDWAPSAASTANKLEMLHYGMDGRVDYIARWDLTPDGAGSRIIAEFSPLPLSLAPPRAKP